MIRLASQTARAFHFVASELFGAYCFSIGGAALQSTSSQPPPRTSGSPLGDRYCSSSSNR